MTGAAAPDIPTLVVAKLNAAIVEALRAFHGSEIEKWWPIVKQAGIKVE